MAAQAYHAMCYIPLIFKYEYRVLKKDYRAVLNSPRGIFSKDVPLVALPVLS